MKAPETTLFSFPVQDFKRIETPLDYRGIRNYICVVDVLDLPDLGEWNNSNVRDPKSKGKVPDAIREGLLERELFVFMNRGIVLIADKVDFDNQRKEVRIHFTKQGVHGIIDGGHTRLIISQEKEMLHKNRETMDDYFNRYVRVEILVGIDISDITDIVSARNTSNQVKEQSLLELEDRFDPLKTFLKNESYYGNIAFKEYELDKKTGEPKSIDIRNIIAIMYMFDVEIFSAEKQPTNAYNAKSVCLTEFKKKISNGKNSVYKNLYSLVPELLRLHDHIHLKLPDLYSKARQKTGDKKYGSFGNLTGVTTRETKLQYTEQLSEYRIPSAFIFPILGAFRASVELKRGKYSWAQDCNPFRLLNGKTGIEIAQAFADRVLEDRNPNKTGKSSSFWTSCYKAVQTARLEAQIEAYEKDRNK